MALAARCREVVGLDLTDAPLAIADRTRRDRGLTNVCFQAGDAENLPFGPAEFDLTVCRFAFHHFEDPARVLAQMALVCRTGGAIAVEDLYASETPERGAYWNAFERLRDHSHTRALALSELIAMFARVGLEILRLYSDELTADTEKLAAGCADGRERRGSGARDARARAARGPERDSTVHARRTALFHSAHGRAYRAQTLSVGTLAPLLSSLLRRSSYEYQVNRRPQSDEGQQQGDRDRNQRGTPNHKGAFPQSIDQPDVAQR
jgi:SAM-dependent methyltransferase